MGGDDIQYCQNCPVGKYLDEKGKTAITFCKSCLAGKINTMVQYQ